MFFRRFILAGALAVCGCVAASSVFAQGRRAMGAHTKPVRPEKPQRKPKESKEQKVAGETAAPLAEFQRMAPRERERQLAALPPDRREKLQRQLQNYDSLSPAQREQLDWFNHLPPERQNSFRKAFKNFQSEAPERQQAMREELARLRVMSDADRTSRLASPEFQKQYKKNEQQILAEMADALPSK